MGRSSSYGGFDPHNLAGDLPGGFPIQLSELIADGQWLMRASAIPAPGAAGLLGAAFTVLCPRRRRDGA